MTVSNQTPRNGPYTGNGSTTSFAYTFRADLDTELVVVLEEDGTETVQTLTTHYTVTGLENASGGTVEMVTAPTSDQTLTIRREVTRQQTIDLQNRKSVIPQVIEDGFDELTRQTQDLYEMAQRSARFPVSSSLTDLEFPVPAAGTAIGWNGTGDGLANISSLPTGSITATLDNAIMRYDSSGGGLQDSGLTIDDSDVITQASGVFTVVAPDGASLQFGGGIVSHTELNILDGLTASTVELNYVAGVTSALQPQLDALTAGKEPANADILKADESDDLTVGYTATPHDEGTVTTGTFTPDMTEGNLQQYINGGAHTLAAPSGEGTMIVQVTNNASAGTITISGFTDQDGDTLTTTNGDDFFLYIAVINGFSTLTVKALQ